MVKFGTLEYFQKVAEVVNASEEMKKTNMNLRMLYDVTDVKKSDGSSSRYLLRFDKGQIAEVREATPTEESDLSYSAKSEIFRKVFSGALNVDDAQRAGWWKMNYKMMTVLKYRAALITYGKTIAAVQAEY